MIKDTFYNKYKSYFDDFGERGFNLVWMTYCANNKKDAQSSDSSYWITSPLPPKEQIKDEVIHHIQEQSNVDVTIQTFHLYIKSMIIPLDYLTWIDPGDIRKICWIKNNLHKLTPKQVIFRAVTNEDLYPELIHSLNTTSKFITYPPQNHIPTGSISFNRGFHHFKKTTGSPLDLLIFEIDKIFIDIEEKLKYLETLKLDWQAVQTPSKMISWIDPRNTKQISWAIEYLRKKNDLVTTTAIPLDLSENLDKYITLIITFDNYVFSNNDARTLFFEKMKKSWSQQKFRAEGKTKKNYHLPLTKNSKDKLEKLSELMNMKENQVLEELIDEKFHNIATDQKGKFKYS